jgi:hypothetical protein
MPPTSGSLLQVLRSAGRTINDDNIVHDAGAESHRGVIRNLGGIGIWPR